MATFARTLVLRNSRLLSWSVLRQTKQSQPVCFISTSKKKKDGLVVEVDSIETKSQELKRLEEHFANTDPKAQKNWVGFGFHDTDKEEDAFAKNLVFFSFFTLLICFGGFYLAYLPDFKNKHWARREAFLELARRESMGLSPISPNYIEPEDMVLPSEEEIGDTEIII